MTNVLSSLLDLIARWFGDEELQEESLRDYLESEDYGDLDAIELYEAVGLYFDTVRVSQRQQGDFSREYNTGARVNVEPPPPPRNGDDHESVDEYVSYLTTNYTYVQDNDTIVDNSVNTQIQADGDVDFDQDVDIDSTVVSGDDNVIGDDNVVATGGGVAAGDDIEDSQIVTGDVDDSLLANQSDADDVVLGDENKVAQDSNAVGFGDGDASYAEFRDVTVDDGGAIAVGGDAEGNNEDNDVNFANFGDGDVQANVNTGDGDLDSEQSIDESVELEDVGNTDNSVEVEDSEIGNTEIEDSEIGNTEIEDSEIGNTDIDIDVEDNDGIDDSIVLL